MIVRVSWGLPRSLLDGVVYARAESDELEERLAGWSSTHSLFWCFSQCCSCCTACRSSWTTKKVNLLLASYVFYAAWNPPFILLLWASTIVDWFIARGIYAARDKSRAVRRSWLVISVAVNIGFIGFFKYGAFLLHNWQALMASFGITWVAPEWNIVLPVGISFYTFVTLSYTLDVYLGRLKPIDSFLNYALFVTFFPHLVAGPIVRPTQLTPQFETPRQATRDQMLWGAGLIVLGLFEKVVVRRRRALERRRSRVCRDGPGRLRWTPGSGRSRSPARSSATSRVTRRSRSASRSASGSRCRTTSGCRTRRSASPISGGAGTSRCRRGCATTSTSRSAAIAGRNCAPTST